MQLTTHPPNTNAFTPLFVDYITSFENLEDFYAFNPANLEGLEEFAEQKADHGNRDKLVDLLNKYNADFELHEKAQQNLERLRNPEAVTVVTGQQLNLFGGPLYTIFKTVTMLCFARRMEKKLGRPVIPVFWMGDEDHDYEEVSYVKLPERDDIFSHQLEAAEEDPLPVSERVIPEAINSLFDTLGDELQETDFTEDLLALLKEYYQPGLTHHKAFGRLMSRLFSAHGLILAGSLDADIKAYTKSILKDSIRKRGEIYEAVTDQSEKLGEKYHQQVTIYNSNLFYLDPEAGRLKIHFDTHSGDWSTDNGRQWNEEELVNEIDEQPGHFSPNVFLRPLIQDTLLPNIAYVAGPGEIAYYGQIKTLYELMDAQMPLIYPRMTATIMEHPIERVFKKLPFELHDYAGRIEDLEQNFARHQEKEDIEEIFSEWKKQVNQLSEEKAGQIAEIDSTLKKAAAKATSTYFNELDKLKGKIHRSVKQQEETQIKRIHRLKANLYPNSVPQERVFSMIYFMNKYGLDLWDHLLENLNMVEWDKHTMSHV